MFVETQESATVSRDSDQDSTAGIDIQTMVQSLTDHHGDDAIYIAKRWARTTAHAGNDERAAAWAKIVEILKNANSS